MKKHKKEHHEEHVDESWLIPYADLLTLLLALFIILFASSKVDAKKYDIIMKSLNSAFTGGSAPFATSNLVPLDISPNVDKSKQDQSSENTKEKQEQKDKQQQQMEKEKQELEELKKKLDAYISDNKLVAELETKLTNDRLIITIRDKALFDSGSAAIKADSQKLGVAIADMLGQYPGYQIEVAGYTDNVPISKGEFSDNWDLSTKRALNFMKVVLARKTLDPSFFSSTGYGEYRPVDTNATVEGRGNNRRVEVSVVRNIKAPE
ncbi:flagellar motor protein MotB [Paenibacillus sp. LMG 31456]|uniref:Flagellar motor protein MotB n=1 Tax=Paenibacillus foliorum TaxID=2654974 RepID=A0A972GN31_9BACL|nr:flagellar motor protein MotB [Paenibacillus foliorum]NOU93313.1 flagellar motor protein MotB [Paenibacillus foliorum]